MDSPAATELQRTDWGVSGLGKIALFPCRANLLYLVLSQMTPNRETRHGRFSEQRV